MPTIDDTDDPNTPEPADTPGDGGDGEHSSEQHPEPGAGQIPMDADREASHRDERWNENQEHDRFEQRIYDGPPGYSDAVGQRYSDSLEEPEEKEMGFFDHLEELRWRIIKALIALVLCAIACGVFLNRIVEDIILGPATRLATPLKLQNTEPMGQIMLAVQVALISGLILSIPFVIWQFWGFIRPGLYERERRVASWVAIATIACFLGGVAFAYFVMIPASLGFSSDFTFAGVENRFTISAYFSFILGFILACGVVFEMPVVSYGLSRFGIITPGFLRKYRRHAIVVILVVAAIVTPTPDPFNQLLLAIPLYGLYELSIYVAVVAKRGRDASGLATDG